MRSRPAFDADAYNSTIRSGSWNGSGFNISAYTDEKIAVVMPMHSASVTSVVPVMRLDFQSRRTACRKSSREPVHRPAEVEAGVREAGFTVQFTLSVGARFTVAATL